MTTATLSAGNDTYVHRMCDKLKGVILHQYDGDIHICIREGRIIKLSISNDVDLADFGKKENQLS